MADAAGWRRFKQVTQCVPTGHKLYRSSAPNYVSRDSDQNLTQATVDFLVGQGIDSIISFNGYEYTEEEKDRLSNAKPPIKYLHLKLGDFKPPTLAQFKQANDFFLQNKSTLVHCGYGHGRTGTGITGLQIYTESGMSLQPLSSVWVRARNNGGNNVETREQVSILSELRNLFFPRVSDALAGDASKAFAIINFATGYYLTLSGSTVIARSPESVETTATIGQAYQWIISKDQGDYALSNKTSASNFALTKSSGAAVGNQLTYGSKTQGNALFAISEVASGDKGRYVIAPKPNSNFAVAIQTPSNTLIQTTQPVVLVNESENNKFGLWILLAGDFH